MQLLKQNYRYMSVVGNGWELILHQITCQVKYCSNLFHTFSMSLTYCVTIDPMIRTTREQYTALHLAARCKRQTELHVESRSSDDDHDEPDQPPLRSVLHYLVAMDSKAVDEKAVC